MPRWTEDEILTLKTLYRTRPLAYIAEKLNKKVKTVSKKARQLKLPRKNIRWTEEELKDLKACKGRMTKQYISELFPEHSYNSVHWYEKKLDLNLPRGHKFSKFTRQVHQNLINVIAPIIILSLFLLNSCTSQVDLSLKAESKYKNITPNKNVDYILDSVVTIVGDHSISTGVVIGPHEVLTSSHGCQDKTIDVVEHLYVNGLYMISSMHSCKILRQDKTADLTELTVKENFSFAKPLDIYKEKLPTIGEKVCVVGFPMGTNCTISQGYISKYDLSREDLLEINTTCPIALGNSGGPIIYKDKIVGIVLSANVMNFTLSKGISSPEILKFLGQNP